MLWPNVVGQSGTARAAPVFVTRPPKTMSTPVAAAVSTARRCASLTPDVSSVSPRAHPRRRLVLRQEVLGRLGVAVLVRPAVDGGHGRAPVEVRRRRGGRPFEGRGVPRGHRRLAARG